MGVKVILAVAVAGDIINKVSKESSGRPSEQGKRNVKRKGSSRQQNALAQMSEGRPIGNV